MREERRRRLVVWGAPPFAAIAFPNPMNKECCNHERHPTRQGRTIRYWTVLSNKVETMDAGRYITPPEVRIDYLDLPVTSFESVNGLRFVCDAESVKARLWVRLFAPQLTHYLDKTPKEPHENKEEKNDNTHLP
jgi:hypothetical protein